MKGYLIKKVYIIVCEQCNEDITRPMTNREITDTIFRKENADTNTRTAFKQAVHDHEHVCHIGDLSEGELIEDPAHGHLRGMHPGPGHRFKGIHGG